MIYFSDFHPHQKNQYLVVLYGNGNHITRLMPSQITQLWNYLRNVNFEIYIQRRSINYNVYPIFDDFEFADYFFLANIDIEEVMKLICSFDFLKDRLYKFGITNKGFIIK